MLLVGLCVCGLVFMLFLLLDILMCCDTNIRVQQRQLKHNCLLSHFVSTYTAAAKICNSVCRNKVIVKSYFCPLLYVFILVVDGFVCNLMMIFWLFTIVLVYCLALSLIINKRHVATLLGIIFSVY